MSKIRYKATNLVELIHGETRTVECPLCDGFFTFQLGDAEVIISGGMESMSQSPYLLPKVRDGLRLGHGNIIDSLLAIMAMKYN